LEKQFVDSLKEGASVSNIFIVKQKDIRKKKDGSDFLSVVLSDKTGSIPGVLWDDVESYSKKFQADDLVKVSGSVRSFDSRLQLTMTSIEKWEEQFNLDDFLPSGEKDIEVLWRQFLELTSEVKNTHLAKLLKNIFTDPDFIKNFKQSPAAMALHHNYLGGLLEHTVTVIKYCKEMAKEYGADEDMLVTGAALHDIGKTEELTIANSFAYSDEGRLIGHLAIADSIISGKIKEIDSFPKEIEILLRHLILSHHGELEWGSPKRPKTVEALILHHMDNMDAKVNMFAQEAKKIKETGWTNNKNPFRRSLFVNKKEDIQYGQQPIDGL
jgi:3'-5' exoribonuclease